MGLRPKNIVLPHSERDAALRRATFLFIRIGCQRSAGERRNCITHSLFYAVVKEQSYGVGELPLIRTLRRPLR